MTLMLMVPVFGKTCFIALSVKSWLLEVTIMITPARPEQQHKKTGLKTLLRLDYGGLGQFCRTHANVKMFFCL